MISDNMNRLMDDSHSSMIQIKFNGKWSMGDNQWAKIPFRECTVAESPIAD